VLRDAYARAVVAEHFPTFDRMRRERRSLAQVTVALPRPPLSGFTDIADGDGLQATATITMLDVRIPLVVQAPPGGTKLSHRGLPLINRTAFFRIMEGQVIDALNVQRAWPADLEQWDGADLERRVLEMVEDDRQVAGEVRRRSEGPRHIREVLAPLVSESRRSSWTAWLKTTARSLASQDRNRRRIVDREED
jgi:hypothetical protein